jgi:hypothetical protein
VGLGGGGGRELRLQRFAGQGAAGGEVAGGPDPLRGLSGPDPEQPGQEGDHVRAAALVSQSAVGRLGNHGLVNHGESAYSRLKFDHQIEEILIRARGQVQGFEVVQHVVEPSQ